MPVIKKKDKLVQRAKDHREADRISKGIYIDLKATSVGSVTFLSDLDANFWDNAKDSDLEFKGCAISCLATPVGLNKRKKFFKNMFSIMKRDSLGEHEILTKRLEKKHGIPRRLSSLCENIFESLEQNGYDVRDWPLEFAEALPEGVNITDEDVGYFVSSDADVNECYYEDTSMAGTCTVDPEYALVAKDKILNWLESLSK